MIQGPVKSTGPDFRFGEKGIPWGYPPQTPTREMISLDPRLRILHNAERKQAPAVAWKERFNLTALRFWPGR